MHGIITDGLTHPVENGKNEDADLILFPGEGGVRKCFTNRVNMKPRAPTQEEAEGLVSKLMKGPL